MNSYLQSAISSINVRGKLLALVAFVACASIAAMTYFTYQSIRDTTISEQGQSLVSQGREVLHFTRKGVDNSTDQLQALALSPTIIEAVKEVNQRNENLSTAEIQGLNRAWENDESGAESLIEEIRTREASQYLNGFQDRFPSQVEVFVTGARGLNVAMTSRTGDYLQKDEDWWKATYNGGEGAVHVGKVARDASTGSYAMNIGVPIRDEEGSTIGVLRGTVDITSLFEELSEVRVGETGRAILVNEEGKLLYAQNEDLIMEPAPENVQQLLQDGTDTWGENQSDLEGNPALVGATFMKDVDGNDLGWMLMLDQNLEEVEAGVQQGLMYSLKVGGVVLLVLLLLGVWVARTISQPIHRLDTAAQEVAAGDLGATVEIETQDEIGRLASSFNQMVGQVEDALDEARTKEEAAQEAQEEATRLAEASQEKNEFLGAEIEDLTGRIERLADGDLTVSFVGGGAGVTSKHTDEAAQMVGQLRATLEEAVQSVRDTLNDVAGATGEVDASAREISASSEQMAASAEEQSTQAEEVAAAVEELNQTINENAQSVQRTADAAEAGGEQARHGGEIVAETAEQIEEIADVVERTADAIERLGTSSEEIGQVVDRIDEIAEQTNLLALNAAIEAARAGEEGKGFAVVAEEVRELAEEADAATNEVAEMIEQVQSEAGEAVERVRKGTDRVEEGRELAEEAGMALEEIVSAIEEVEERADEIAAASEEQSTTSEQIAQSVQSISTAARESAQGVTEVSNSADQLDALTDALRKSVREFTLGEEGEGDAFDSAPSGGASAQNPSLEPAGDRQYGGDGHPTEDAPL